MNRDRFLRVKKLFHEALPLDESGRTTLLLRECADDPELRNEVVDLLAHATSASATFLAGVVAPESPGDEHPRLVIPGFRIIGHHASGSAGVVYRAHQLSPSREVALKVLRLDTLGPGQVARFQREAEILAALNHPGIAHVYGAGVAEGGSIALPWIAMELVHGVALDVYVATREPDTRALLELFRSLCDAVDHAHERGIVHRDLKPSNVIVEESGRPRVLDFGIARMLGESVDRLAQRTRTGMVLGTLSTMAPEQARGDRKAVDARADVYALGVLLHEAFAGRPPLDVDDLDVIEAVRIVCTVEPERLSRARPDLPADLDAIVGKALEKDPARRYARAGELAADLANLLENRPVRARAPTRFDQARRFVQRHRAVTIAASLIFTSLAVGLLVALVALRNQALQRAMTSETIDFLARRMIALAPQIGFGEEQRADLEEVVARIEQQLAVDLESSALRAAHAQSLYELASLDQERRDFLSMRARLEKALTIWEDYARENPANAEAWTHRSRISAKLGEAARELGDDELRDAWFARALEIDERLVREHSGEPEFVEDLGWSLARLTAVASARGEYAEAERLALRRLSDALRLEEIDPDNWKFVFNLSDAHHVAAGLCRIAGRPDQELEHALEAVRLARRVLQIEPGRRDFVGWSAYASRAVSEVLRRRGRLVEARAHAENALNAAEELALGDPRRPAHLDILLALASELAREDLGEQHRERSARAASSLRRVAEVAARAGRGAHAADMTTRADSIEMRGD